MTTPLAIPTGGAETTTLRRRSRLAALARWPWAAIALLSPVVICGVFGPWLYPHDPTALNLLAPLKPPAWYGNGSLSYFLGTDQFGRDLLSRLIEGARVALIVSIGGVFASGAIGISTGILAGYYGGIVDDILMRIVDIKMAIPTILLSILIASAVGGGLITIICAVIFIFWGNYARVVRGETLVLRERGFVALAKVANCSDFWILTRHIFPNLTGTFIVLTALQFGRAILIESTVTFIGLGVQPPASAWGLLIAEGRGYLATAWWIPTFAGLAITITVFGANLLGDWMRDTFDPRLHRN